MNYRVRRIDIEQEKDKEFGLSNLLIINHGRGPSILTKLILDQYHSLKERLYERFSKNSDWITFTDNEIIVQEKGLKRVFSYDQMDNLKIEYSNSKYNWHESLEMETRFSAINFTLDSKKKTFHFNTFKSKIVCICEYLFTSKVAFKEYHNRQRVHLGKKPRYKEIQELKLNDHFEW